MTGSITGFIKGLFGKKDDNQQKEAFFLDAENNQQKEAFFLDADSASSLGNVDFMRQPKTIKKSFPQGAGKINQITGETEQSMSSVKRRESTVEAKNPSNSSTSSPTQSSIFNPTPVKPSTISKSNDKSTSAKPSTMNRSKNKVNFNSMARDLNKNR